MDKNRFAGSLLGLAVGDALGTTLEFSGGSAIADDYTHRLDGPHRDVSGGGPFAVQAGQVTDDTMMATCIARSLTLLGTYDPDEVAGRYLRWRSVTFDIGGLTSSSLSCVAEVGARQSGRTAWEKSNRQSCGNGGLMRCGPIGAYFAGDEEARLAATIEDAEITHFDPRSVLACVALNGAIAGCINGQVEDREGLIAVAKRQVLEGAEILRSTHEDLAVLIDTASRSILFDLDSAAMETPFAGAGFHATSSAGFARTGLRLAFWEVFHAKNYADALIDCVNRGGDTDTNGAICGALAGAYFGLDSIPAAWTERVLGALQDRPATDALASEFHPKAFLDLYAARVGEPLRLPKATPTL